MGRAAENKDDACSSQWMLQSLSPGKQRFQGAGERGKEGGAEDNIREKRSVLRARRQPNSVATSFVMLRNELLEKHPFRVQLRQMKAETPLPR